ncbi:MAG: Rieske (2Fe-2S) protein [Planctomycetaceae bacterium]
MSDVESPDPSSIDSASPTSEPHGSPTGRRHAVIELVTAFLGFLVVAVPSTIGGLFFLDPLIRGKRQNSGIAGPMEGFIRLSVAPDSIPDDGTPVAVSVRTDLDDAWNRFKDVPVGSIWLRKTDGGKIIAFNSVCPHLGCSVDYRRSKGDFYCPCHTSAFSLDGQKTNDVPPRNMDDLEIIVAANGQPNDTGSELWVKFQNFRKTIAEKEPI